MSDDSATQAAPEPEAAPKEPEYIPVTLGDIVFHGHGLFRPWDVAGGYPRDSRTGFGHANY